MGVMTDEQPHWSLACGCVYTVNLYISSFVCCAKDFPGGFLAPAADFPKALKEKEDVNRAQEFNHSAKSSGLHHLEAL